MTLPDAMHAYQLEHKKIFIDVYTHWCGWCKKMDASTFRDSGVADYMNKNFYAVKFDAETKDTVFFKDKAYVFRPEYKANEFATMILNGQMGYPTSVYFDEDLNLIGPVPGYLTTEQMLPTLRYFGENLYKTTDWQEYIKKNLH
ncbi:MAG: DUF255 domain-containing protein [Bacteroidia bacterium]|nr:DUF255 domain-containing protein [Bacteroidia bacterium]